MPDRRESIMVLCRETGVAGAIGLHLSPLDHFNTHLVGMAVSRCRRWPDSRALAGTASDRQRATGGPVVFRWHTWARAGFHQCLSDALFICGRPFSIYGQRGLDRVGRGGTEADAAGPTESGRHPMRRVDLATDPCLP